MSHAFEVCEHNANINCATVNCAACGWNPVVAKARAKVIRKRREEALRRAEEVKLPHEDCKACPYYKAQRKGAV